MMVNYYCTAGRGTEPFVAGELNAITGVTNVKETDGKVYFSSEDCAIPHLLHLRSVERLFIEVKNFTEFRLKRKKDIEDLGNSLANTVDWIPISNKHQLFRECLNKDGEDGAPPAKKRKLDESESKEGPEEISFRISCKLAGNLFVMFDHHAVSKQLASHIRKKLDWRVDLRNPLMEICVHVGRTGATVGIPVTKTPLSQRAYLTTFGMRSTVAWIMGKLANIKPGDLVLDPMCGVATILLEASQNWPQAQYIGIDSNPDQVERAQTNIGTKAGSRCNLMCADATNLPIQSNTVDALVCDMPFGNKYVKVIDLIPKALKEFHRVLKPGRTAVLLISSSLKEELITQASTMTPQSSTAGTTEGQSDIVCSSTPDSLNEDTDLKHSHSEVESSQPESTPTSKSQLEGTQGYSNNAKFAWDVKETHYLKLGETHAYACVLIAK